MGAHTGVPLQEMARTVKHFSLHRIAGDRPELGEGIELRVISDVETGVLPVIQVEEAVIRGYVRAAGLETCPAWPHRWVTLFIMHDLQPLVRQLRRVDYPVGRASVPPGGAAALDHRPVVNVYDLADPDACQVFVNQQAMVREGYWDDPLAIRGLLAHEHAHPLAENGTTQASRQLRLDLEVDSGQDLFQDQDRKSKITSLLALLADELSLNAPREIFANELTIRGGFGEALLHLDRRNVATAGRSVAGREDLVQQLQQQVAHGTLTPAAADLLLLVGDLRSTLNLVLEVAPFYRTGRESDARELETVLETAVFPHLEPQVARAYVALRQETIALCADLSLPGFVAWSEGVLRILAEALAEKGLLLETHLRRTDQGTA